MKLDDKLVIAIALYICLAALSFQIATALHSTILMILAAVTILTFLVRSTTYLLNRFGQ